ncbi:hypothetical protein FB45DRAFT_877413 [Roridomyces roridus]|uniref:Uncharacterized protein n=1 Tax=Roridomyces roridus TaxID=1738132 RepID=A0AAD7B2V7_9AGAR|nr:hypothetical protein FB45DRAFT_877413 [Roridomyces roridus]
MDIGNGGAREGGMEGVQGERCTQAAMCGDMCTGENVCIYTWGGDVVRLGAQAVMSANGKRLQSRKQCSRGFEREDWREGRGCSVGRGDSIRVTSRRAGEMAFAGRQGNSGLRRAGTR